MLCHFETLHKAVIFITGFPDSEIQILDFGGQATGFPNIRKIGNLIAEYSEIRPNNCNLGNADVLKMYLSGAEFQNLNF